MKSKIEIFLKYKYGTAFCMIFFSYVLAVTNCKRMLQARFFEFSTDDFCFVHLSLRGHYKPTCAWPTVATEDGVKTRTMAMSGTSTGKT